jgi:hypothetical protein
MEQNQPRLTCSKLVLRKDLITLEGKLEGMFDDQI